MGWGRAARFGTPVPGSPYPVSPDNLKHYPMKELTLYPLPKN